MRTGTDRKSLTPSPCTNVCTLDRSSGLCVGCGRTVAEITAWSRSSDDEKRNILAAVAARRRPSAERIMNR